MTVDAAAEVVVTVGEYDALRELGEYAEHASWRCAYRTRYKRCQCGLDDLCDRMGIPRILVIDPEEKK